MSSQFSFPSTGVDAWSALAEERGVSIQTRAAPVVARGGSGRVEQVLDNLLSNALDASPRGATIRVATARRNGWVEMHVVDEGPGLVAAARAHAFDRFWHAEVSNCSKRTPAESTLSSVSAPARSRTVRPCRADD